MAKKYYLKFEYAIILFILFGFLMLVTPFSFGNTRQAWFISKWNETFNRVEYMFSVINAHITEDIIRSMNKAKTPEQREKILLSLIKPYLRINTENKPKRYKPKYVNGSRVYKGQTYYFDDFYFAENNTIVGIKDIQSDDVLFIMMFDINGILPPNRWGKDIYGVSIYDCGKIKPFGEGLDIKSLKKDCLQTGINCSYYYKIGGGFED